MRTQLKRCGEFYRSLCKISSRLKRSRNHRNRLNLVKAIVNYRLPTFFWTTVYNVAPHMSSELRSVRSLLTIDWVNKWVLSCNCSRHGSTPCVALIPYSICCSGFTVQQAAPGVKSSVNRKTPIGDGAGALLSLMHRWRISKGKGKGADTCYSAS